MDRDLVRRWLREVLQPVRATHCDSDTLNIQYPEQGLIFADVEAVLDEMPTLLPRTDVYTYDDGRSQLLLRLSGTLPVSYRGQVYYIPTDFWVPQNFPREPPIVYVVPTREMLVRRSANVEPSGRVTTDYLRAWLRKPEGCHILGLVRSCQALFAVEPPVYTRPAGTSSTSPAASTPTPPTPPRPPKPTESAAHAQGAPPEPAPKPAALAPTRAPTPPPVPPTAAPPSPAHPAAERPASAAIPPTAHPPRPLNPELERLHGRVHDKLSTRLRDLRGSLAHANEQLGVLHEDLQRGYPAIQDEMQRLRAVRDVCGTSASRLQDTLQTAHARTVALQQKEDVGVDQMLVATSIIENQLLQLVAEDHAIEDTLYQLGRALLSERIALDRFMKHTRLLAREQFMRRALAMKIIEGIGWQV